MKRVEHILDRSHFTSMSALVREVAAWLEFSPCKITVLLFNKRQEEELMAEMGDTKTMGRVVVKMKV